MNSFLATGLNSGLNFNYAWQGCTALTAMPAIALTAGTNFSLAWRYCSSMNSFLATGLDSGLTFDNTWAGCTSLTTMPAIPLTAATTLTNTWNACTAITSWLVTDIDLVRTFSQAWINCTALVNFPANVFDDWSPASRTAGCFNEAWGYCTALSATSVENILNSLATAGVAAPSSSVDITIDFNASTGTPSVATAVGVLKGLSPPWTITLNGVAQ